MIDRRTLMLGASSAAVIGMTPIAQAQSAWPTKAVKIVVPFPAGGPTDFIVRLMTAQLADIVGQPVLVENKPGVSGNLGAQQVAESDPDGHTLVHNTVGVQAVNPLMFPNTKFNAQRDLVGVATTASMPNVLVVNPRKLNVKSMRELVEYGRQQQGRLTVANFGSGTSAHIYGALLQKVGGFQATEVPYRGSALALTDVIGGQVDCLFDSMTTCVGHVQSGNLRGLALTSPTRSALLPDVPTMAEAGYPAFDLKFWFALFASARTPRPVLEAMQAALAKVLADPAYVAALKARGAEPLVTPPSELPRFLTADSERWSAVARQIGVKPQT